MNYFFGISWRNWKKPFGWCFDENGPVVVSDQGVVWVSQSVAQSGVLQGEILPTRHSVILHLKEARVSGGCLLPCGDLYEDLQQVCRGCWTGQGLREEASEEMFGPEQQAVNFLIVLITFWSIHPFFILSPCKIYWAPMSGSVFIVQIRWK